jgi:hypothetical protein
MCVELGTKVAEVALEIAVHPAGTLVGFSVGWLHANHCLLIFGSGLPIQLPKLETTEPFALSVPVMLAGANCAGNLESWASKLRTPSSFRSMSMAVT